MKMIGCTAKVYVKEVRWIEATDYKILPQPQLYDCFDGRKQARASFGQSLDRTGLGFQLSTFNVDADPCKAE